MHFILFMLLTMATDQIFVSTKSYHNFFSISEIHPYCVTDWIKLGTTVQDGSLLGVHDWTLK